MPAETQDFPAGERIPDFYRLILATAGEESVAVAADGQASDDPFMGAPTALEFAGLCVPDLYRAVETGRRKPATIRPEHDCTESMSVLAGLVVELARVHVPNTQHSSPAAGGQKPAVGTERRARRRAFVLLREAVNFPAVGRIPNGREAVLAAGH